MTVYLESHYRSWLFCKAYMNSGESLSALAKELGYKGQGKNGVVREMWLGKHGISEEKFTVLCQIAKVPHSEAESYSTLREKVTIVKDWIPIIHFYKKHNNPSPDIFLTKSSSLT